MGESIDKEQCHASKQFLEQHDHFLVVSHVMPDGDAASSTCAVGLILKALNKTYTMMNEHDIPRKLSYLPGYEQINIYSERAFPHLFDAVIAVDCADYSRIGNVATLFAPDVKLLNIDHHATNNHYGQLNLINTEAASTTEVLFDLIEYMNMDWTPELAECIYTGLLTDTGGFRYANTTSKVMRIASELLKHGVDAHVLADHLLEKVSMSHVEILGRALQRLSFADRNRLSWLSVSLEDMAAASATNEDLEGIVNYPRNIEGVEVGIFFKELLNNEVKVSLRSTGTIDVASFAQQFGGGGHRLAAGVTISGSLDDVIDRVTDALKGQLT